MNIYVILILSNWINITKTRESQIKFNKKVLIELVELFSYMLAHYADLTVLSIVENTVVKNQLHIRQEVLNLYILIAVQVSFDSPEVHWSLDDVQIVWNAQFHVVNRLIEDPSV